MGLQKLGTTLAEQCTKYAKACGKSGILCTKPIPVQDISNLKYTQELTKDVVQLEKPINKFSPIEQNIIKASSEDELIILGQKISPDKHVRALSTTICFLFFSVPAVGTELARLNSGGLKHVIQTVESQGGKVQLFSDFLYHSLVLL